jgi:hypothetical protein
MESENLPIFLDNPIKVNIKKVLKMAKEHGSQLCKITKCMLDLILTIKEVDTENSLVQMEIFNMVSG